MNPADLYRNESLPQLDDDPPLSSKAINGVNTSLQKNAKPAVTVPRIDTEPIYTQLKAAIGERWGDYRLALSTFMLGKYNQAELTRIITPLLSSAPSVASSTNPSGAPLTSALHLHNTLITAVYANVFRDPPPEPVAPWVLATDAPSALHGTGKTSSGAAGAGDKAEERLKREVMALSARDRRRLKNVKDTDGMEGNLHDMQGYRSALSVRTTEPVNGVALGGGAVGGAGLSRTNWDLEIRRRFAMPLATETLDFPSRADIQARIEPICYEEGLGGGVAQGALQACAEMIETAAEVFVKEMLETWFAVARVNGGESLVQTNRYKRQLRREEAQFDRGELEKDQNGLLPAQSYAVSSREPLGMDEVRVALLLDQGRLRENPFLGRSILEDHYTDMDIDNVEQGKINGVLPALKLEVNGHGPQPDRAADHDAMALDDNDWGWQGSNGKDRDTLMDVLAGTLAVGV